MLNFNLVDNQRVRNYEYIIDIAQNSIFNNCDHNLEQMSERFLIQIIVFSLFLYLNFCITWSLQYNNQIKSKANMDPDPCLG